MDVVTVAEEPPVVWLGRRLSPALLAREEKGWRKVHQEGHCRLCLRPSHVRLLTRHHLVPLGWFRRQVAKAHGVEGGYIPTARSRVEVLLPRFAHADANIVPLCQPCHVRVEGSRSDRRMLRRSLTQAEVAFVVQIAGKEWLDWRYPDGRDRIAAMRLSTSSR